jgi:hypothetical protein
VFHGREREREREIGNKQHSTKQMEDEKEKRLNRARLLTGTQVSGREKNSSSKHNI